MLTNSRVEINMTNRQLHQVDSIRTPLIEQEQSQYQNLINQPQLELAVHSLYIYIDNSPFFYQK